MTSKRARTVLLAISGTSCSGKTTLSRLLRDALQPHAFILHEDDFYVTDAQIPVVATSDGRKIQDWDCLEAIDLAGLEAMLSHIKSTGRLKPGFDSKEDQNAVGDVALDARRMDEARGRLRAVVEGWREGEQVTVAIVDGFLLFAEKMQAVRELFDVKLLLTTDYATLKRRREARKGYVTLEGFWEDPPGYVDDVVWPNFVKDHRFLYTNESIDDGVDEETCYRLDISCMPADAREDMTRCFTWATEIILRTLKH